MVEQKIKRIKDFLIEYNSTVELLPKSKMAQLEKVDEAIQKRLLEIEHVKDMLKRNPINV